ncbi:hypothetical protein, partial [Propionibacterium freudenreichii]|uniref:hypothetical protein n=1 Tax=Propionibacterium freudenreichii TaxID=1744 RepID=UPI0038551786
TELMKSIVAHLKTTSEKEFKLLNAEFPEIGEKIPTLKLKEAQEIIFKETARDNRQEPDLEQKTRDFFVNGQRKNTEVILCL